MSKESMVVYSHYIDLQERVVNVLTERFGSQHVVVRNGNGMMQIQVVTDKKFWGGGNKLTINARQRTVPGYQLTEITDAVTQNLTGLYNMLNSLPCTNELVKGKLLMKVTTINTEMAVIGEPKFTEAFKEAMAEIVKKLDAFVFSFAGSSLALFGVDTQGVFDQNGKLILDTAGNCAVSDLHVEIESKYHPRG